MIYDEQALRQLEGDARAAAFRLGKVAAPVQARIQQEQDAFNLLTATAADYERQNELLTLLGVMQAYCEAADAYTQQLQANLKASQEAMYAEATRAAFMAKQFQLTHQDLLREKQMSNKWWDTCQLMLASKKGGQGA